MGLTLIFPLKEIELEEQDIPRFFRTYLGKLFNTNILLAYRNGTAHFPMEEFRECRSAIEGSDPA